MHTLTLSCEGCIKGKQQRVLFLKEKVAHNTQVLEMVTWTYVG